MQKFWKKAFTSGALAVACAASAAVVIVPSVASAEGGTVIYVTENIPWAKCDSVGGDTPKDRLYKCTVEGGFKGVIAIMGNLIKYATYITGLIGVLMIVVSGIQYSMSGGGEDAKKAKGRIIQLVAGLVLLMLTGFILNSIAPWVYK